MKAIISILAVSTILLGYFSYSLYNVADDMHAKYMECSNDYFKLQTDSILFYGNHEAIMLRNAMLEDSIFILNQKK